MDHMIKEWRRRLSVEILSLVLLGSVGAVLVTCNDDGGNVEVLECIGTCTCDQDTRTCSCAGGTTCTIEGAENVTLVCEGNASCDLACGVGCHVICPGTTGCTAEIGDDGTAECQGTAECDYTCLGDCQVTCSGSPQCIVRCADGYACTILACDGQITECGDGIQACRTTCPAVD